MSERMVRIVLRRSVGLRRGPIYGPGAVDVPESVASALGATGHVVSLGDSGARPRVERTESTSERLKTAEDVAAAFSTRDAERYLARITDPAEVSRLAELDARKSLQKAYAARLAELGV